MVGRAQSDTAHGCINIQYFAGMLSSFVIIAFCITQKANCSSFPIAGVFGVFTCRLIWRSCPRASHGLQFGEFSSATVLLDGVTCHR